MEGHQVSLALRDGTRFDDCNLVSGGRNRLDTVWLFVKGEDVFVSRSEVVDIWATEADPPHAA